MLVKFYNTKSDPLQLNKTLTDEITLDCDITDTIDIENPVFRLDRTFAKMNRNFAFVNDWGKYYFLREPSIPNGNHIEISGTIDPLMSNKNAILNAQIIVDRSSSSYEEYMEDSMITDSGKIAVRTYTLGNIFDTQSASNNYVLILGGK